MASPTSFLKRLLVGRPVRSDRLQHTLLPKRIALPIFASDALSSVAYAPDEILLTLSVGGAAFYAYSWRIALGVALVMLVVVASYRQNVHAYPSGGGDYEVATVNLGSKFGLVVASALMVDYVLTVAVSVSSGIQNLGSAWGFAGKHPVEVAVAVVAILAAMNLRGIREAGITFAIPTYAFMIGVLCMVGWGLFRIFVLGDHIQAESASLNVVAKHPFTGLAFTFLMVRAFSSGCAALTGVEAISNGVPAFKKPKSRNAATTLLMLGLLAITMLLGIVVLARLTHLQMLGIPGEQPVTPQLAHAVFGGTSPAFYLIIATTALILVLAANTAFNGFPVLGSILAQDRYLPRQLHTRGDRLAFSNGIVFLATFAIVLIVAFKAQPTHLIQLYIVGVFVSFTLSQLGMLRHWNRLLRTERDRSARRRMFRSRTINGIGLVMTGSVLILVVATKFLAGAWISIAAMVVIYLTMISIRRHYDHVANELDPADERPLLPARNHAIVLVSKVHLPTLRALAYAQATRPDTLTAVTVNVDDADTRRIQAEWEARDVPVPLTIIDSPYREITRPIIDYVKRLRSQSPRDVVTVFIPEYVVGKWFENLLHNQSALRLKGRLLYEPGVMVTSVPWQLHSSVGKDLSRLDRGFTLGPMRGPRGQRVPKGQAPVSNVTTTDTATTDTVTTDTVTTDTATTDEPTGQPGAADGVQLRPGVAAMTTDAVTETIIGTRLELLVGPIAHGGHWVARADDGRVVFVRHALPGERVVAEVTEYRPGYLRADAVTIVDASPDRVEPPCRYAGPDRCGGCDFQHVRPAAQAELKAAVVREQLIRLGRLTPAQVEALSVRVEALPGGPLQWRSRLRYTVDAQGRAGLLKHRSHEVVPVAACAIAVPQIQRSGVTNEVWPDDDVLDVAASDTGDVSVIGTPAGRPPRRISGPAKLQHSGYGRSFQLDPATFWQVHPAAAETFTEAVLQMLEPRPGERAWDLYGGAGLFAAALAESVGPSGSVVLVESDERAVLDASGCLADLPNVTIMHGTVERVNLRGRPDIVVLDPPRAGAGTRVVRRLVASGARAIAYVACDPAAFGRDVATFRGAGWDLVALRAFDAFPMTHHVECIGLLVPPG